MISFDILILFSITTLVVVLSPGPAAVAVVSEAAAHGYKRSLMVIFGISAANVVFFILSATGISALIISSHLLFTIIKWIGAAYLIYLGLTALLSKTSSFSLARGRNAPGSRGRVFLRGFVLELSNPKALLYFSALLPQFINTSQTILPQLAILGLITLLLDLVCYNLYAVMGFQSSKIELQPSITKWINRTAGGVLIFAGLKMSTIER